MPELPEVQVFQEYVDATSLHQRIEAVESEAEDLRRTVPASRLGKRLKGRTIRSTRRHGKHLFLELEGDGRLRLHFGMTGSLRYYKGNEDSRPEHTALRLDFPDDYHLAYTDVRKFGEIGLVDDVDEFVKAEGLGPDAASLDLDGFRERLSGRRGTIKGTLVNQEVLAGLGNEYSDEILFRARVHPSSPTAKLDEDSAAALYRAMGQVFDEAIAARADPGAMPDDFLLPHREEGASCPRCGHDLDKIEVGGRPTYLCPYEQKRPDREN